MKEESIVNRNAMQTHFIFIRVKILNNLEMT